MVYQLRWSLKHTILFFNETPANFVRYHKKLLYAKFPGDRTTFGGRSRKKNNVLKMKKRCEWGFPYRSLTDLSKFFL